MEQEINRWSRKTLSRLLDMKAILICSSNQALYWTVNSAVNLQWTPRPISTIRRTAASSARLSAGMLQRCSAVIPRVNTGHRDNNVKSKLHSAPFKIRL